MKDLSRNKLLVKLVEDAKKDDVRRKEYNVAGCVHPLRPEMTARGNVPVGSTVDYAVREACKSAGVSMRLAKYGVAQIGRRDVKRGVTVWTPVAYSNWKTRTIEDGELLRFRVLPKGGGGGGGKNPLRTILTIVVTIVSIVASVYFPPAMGFVAGTWQFGLAAGLTGLAVSTIGMVLVNAIAPVKAPSIGNLGISNNREAESQVYSVSAGQNSINQWGRVPVPLGRGRFAAPKAASPYTETIGEDQYLHELLCLGIGDMDISDIRIGTTPIGDFNDVAYEIYTHDPNNPQASVYYPTGHLQEDMNVQLKYNVWSSRTTSECDSLEIDLGFQGLAYYNDNGNPTTTGVSFRIQHKPVTDGGWNDVSFVVVGGKSISLSPSTVGSGRNVYVYVSATNSAFAYDQQPDPNTYITLAAYRATQYTTTERVYSYNNWSLKQKYPDLTIHFDWTREEYYVDVPHTHVALSAIGFAPSSARISVYGFPVSTSSGGSTASISVGSGDLTFGAASTVLTIYGAQSRLLRKTWSSGTLTRGKYAVRIMRMTGDSTDDRLKNDSFWTALRSVTNDPPVNTPYPVMLLALRIRATGQLSGSIQTLTHYYETKCLDYDKATNTWIKRYTSNPASIFRYVLQNANAMARPQDNTLIDLPSLQEAHSFWKDKGWEYNLICDADASVFERLQSICAAGLASPTMVDGKWGIIIDKPRDTVVCAFTSANSWGWSFKRSQVRLPNAIHCSFINQETWDTDMRVVPTDEPNTGNYVYETQDYEGVNLPDQVYQLARFHYGDAKVRRRTITLRAYDEAILCTRGDLVECACPMLNPQGLQVGRVREVFRDENGLVTHFTTDQQQTTDNGTTRSFGVKVYLNDGTIAHAVVKAENKSQRRITLLTPQGIPMEKGDKYAFGDYDEETFQAIVLSLKYNADWTCDVVLQDYQPQLYGRLDEEIPDFKSVITKTIAQKWKLNGKPVIKKVTTDETALMRTANSTVPRIMVDYAHPANLDPDAKFVRLEVSEEGRNVWRVAVNNAPLSELRLFAGDVVENNTYDIRMAYAGDAGQIGDYVYSSGILVTGRTTPPTPVTGIFVDGNMLRWVHDNAPLDVIGYRVYVTMDYDDPFSYAKLISDGYVTVKEFDMTRWRGSSRAFWVCAVDELGLLSEPRKVLVDLGGDVEDNIVDITYESSAGRHWPGTVENGTVYEDKLRSINVSALYKASVPAYKKGVQAYLSPEGSSFVYTTSYFMINAREAKLRVIPSVASGRLISMEYTLLDVAYPYASGKFPYSAGKNAYSLGTDRRWSAMPDYITLHEYEAVRIRFTSQAGLTTIVPEITFALDVPDAEPYIIEDLDVEDKDTRLPIPQNYFRWIKDIKFTLQYKVGEYGINVLTIDKGRVNRDVVTEGPLVRVIDKDGNATSGCIDAIVYGVSV